MTVRHYLDEYGNPRLALDSRGFIDTTAGLEPVVMTSLFTRVYTPDSDKQSAYWADMLFGSKLFLLERENSTPASIQQAKSYADTALKWLIAAGLASSVTVEVTKFGADSLLEINIIPPEGGAYQFLWDPIKAVSR